MGKSKPILYLARHGESQFNARDLFTGFLDISLSNKGIEQALALGGVLKNKEIDLVFSSDLIRAEMTAFLALHEYKNKILQRLYWSGKETAHRENILPIYISEKLRERGYGILEGKNKAEVKKEVGEAQFLAWRRTFRGVPPQGESLQMVESRVIPFFEEALFPFLSKGKSVLVVAHGNSLRALVRYLEGWSEEQIIGYEIPTGTCMGYVLKEIESIRKGHFEKLTE